MKIDQYLNVLCFPKSFPKSINVLFDLSLPGINKLNSKIF